MKKPFWEDLYSRDELLWGPRPDYALVEYAHLIPKGHVLSEKYILFPKKKIVYALLYQKGNSLVI